MGGNGFDTVGVSYPCEPHPDVSGCRLSVSDYGQPGQTVRASLALEAGGFAAVGVGGRCWIEVSVPKALNGTNAEPATAAQVRSVVANCYAEASERFVPSGHVDPLELRLKRADVVRDFSVPANHQPGLLDGLAGFSRGHRWTVRRFLDAERRGAQTLRIGPRAAWSATLYDKGAEQGLPLDQLRFEARLRSGFLRTHTAREVLAEQLLDPWDCLGDLTDQGAQALARNRFDLVRYGTSVEGRSRLAAILNDSGLSVREQRGLVTYLACDFLGVDTGMSDNTERKYRRLATKLGIVANLHLGEMATQRLDFDQGTAVLKVCDESGDDQVPPTDG
jgi:hypothetical protein